MKTCTNCGEEYKDYYIGCPDCVLGGNNNENSMQGSDRVISDDFTDLFKIFFPILWFVALGLNILFNSIIEPYRYFFIFIWLAGFIVISFTFGRIKKVGVNKSSLVISSFSRSITVNFSDIESVSGSFIFLPHLVWLKLKKDTAFGKTILFMPKIRHKVGEQAYLFKHPIVDELSQKINEPNVP